MLLHGMKGTKIDWWCLRIRCWGKYLDLREGKFRDVLRILCFREGAHTSRAFWLHRLCFDIIIPKEVAPRYWQNHQCIVLGRPWSTTTLLFTKSNEDEMGRTCYAHGGDAKCIQDFLRNSQIHSAGKIQIHRILKQVANIVWQRYKGCLTLNSIGLCLYFLPTHIAFPSHNVTIAWNLPLCLL
jgi:hypothetical protein